MLQHYGQNHVFRAAPIGKHFMHRRSFSLRLDTLRSHGQYSYNTVIKESSPSDKHCCHACSNKHMSPKIKQALVAAFLAEVSLPLPSLAEQHSGLFSLADMDAKTAGTIASVLAPVLTLSILLMICRIPLSWYPNLNVKKLPWVIAVLPTEPVLGPTRKAIPPVGGVDVAPIIWVSLLTFVNEILLGPQGILNLLQRKVDVL